MGGGPTYAAGFQCVGAACEDDCCHGWPIPLDRRTYELYRAFPEQPLGRRVKEFVAITPAAGPGSAKHVAEIRPAPGGWCAFFEQDRLCGIQREYGPVALSASCSLYPRNLNWVGTRLEGSLTLSCPEAARQVLLVEGATELSGDLIRGGFRTDHAFWLGSGVEVAEFEAVRALLVQIVRARVFSIVDRVLLIGLVCERLGAAESVSFIAERVQFEAVIASGRLPSALREMPGSAALRVEMILEWSGRRAADRSCGRRFQDTFWAFIEGIGSAGGDAAGEDVARFRAAEQTVYAAYLERSPFVLENLLLNYLYQHLFPFGRADGAQPAAGGVFGGVFGEYLLLATQFAWITGLLIGVAASEGLTDEIVVRTVQSFFRAVEHYPEVLAAMSESVKARGLGSVAGMALLLRS